MITRKQQEEINFLCETFGGKQEDKEKYIERVVYGKNKEDNSLFQAKRRLDITIKMWQEDLKTGIITKRELLVDADPYLTKIINSIC